MSNDQISNDLNINKNDIDWDPFQNNNQQEIKTDIDTGIESNNESSNLNWPKIDEGAIHNENEEDEWADFVQTPVTITKNSSHSTLIDQLTDDLFKNYSSEFKFKKNNDSIPNDLNLNLNETWSILINDHNNKNNNEESSISLKFKWYLSNLEDNYLKSLNLERVKPSVSLNLNQLSFNDILQPVKLDHHITTPTPSINTVTNTIQKQNNLNLASNNVNNNNNQILDIDLSYFESDNKSSNTKTNTMSNNSNKGYLDQLLNDIYASP